MCRVLVLIRLFLFNLAGSMEKTKKKMQKCDIIYIKYFLFVFQSSQNL